jgi:GTPase
MSKRSPGHHQIWTAPGSAQELPLVAIVGRPNVGKSTLVNRLVGRREAIVEERPGVTRDRKYFEVEWLGHHFRVVDTGGWLDTDVPLDRQVSRQAELAVKEADAVVLVTDVTVGVTEEDAGVAGLLRRSGKPILIVANKADHPNRDVDAWALARLGLGEPIPISAMHGRSADILLDRLLELLPAERTLIPSDDDAVADDEADEALGAVARPDGAADDLPADAVRPFAVALVGRPNVGKSTLFNRLVGDERSIVHDMAGTTRDTIDTIVETEEGVLRFIDTAGIRRRSRIDDGVEFFSLVRALKAVDAADATLLVIDATEGVTHQDQRLAERVDAAGCAVVIVLNKWDLVGTDDREEISAEVADKLAFLAYAPVLRVSALTGRGALRILPSLRQARSEYRRRVPTAKLNEILQAAQRRHPPPPGEGGRRPRVLYATQGATDPPTFTLFASRNLPAPYMRYLERSIREAFSFGPTPIKLRVRRRDG